MCSAAFDTDDYAAIRHQMEGTVVVNLTDEMDVIAGSGIGRNMYYGYRLV